jgi:hypothetical protein
MKDRLTFDKNGIPLYPKINSLYMRSPTTKQIMLGQYSQPEFRMRAQWHVTEKMDGMNLRLHVERVEPGEVNLTFGGRTDRADLSAKHIQRLLKKVGLSSVYHKVYERLVEYLHPDKWAPITFFGELIGPKIQEPMGSKYNTEGFILFDVYDHYHHRFLDPDEVYELSQWDNQIRPAPGMGFYEIPQLVKLVREGFRSKIAPETGCLAEGVVCRLAPLVYHHRGKPIMFKLKTRDFKVLR